MRRFGAVVAVVAAVAVLSGCTGGLPSGVDGDLTNGWPAMPAPKVAVPTVGVCYDKAATNGVWCGDFVTQDCLRPHAVETVFVGNFTGPDADRSNPPSIGGQARAAAYAQCRKGAVDYLGDDYHLGMLRLTLVMSSPAAWAGGARWYRCDITRFTDALADTVDLGGGSVKDGPRGAHTMALTCYNDTAQDNQSVQEHAITCDQPHNAELAGMFTAPDISWPSDEKAREDLAFKGCEPVVAGYLGFAGGHDNSTYLGYAISFFDEGQWTLGDRTIRCSVIGLKNDSPNNVRFTGSVKGLRDRKPQGWM